MLVNLCGRGDYTSDLFAATQTKSSENLIGVMDDINVRWGRSTLWPSRVPVVLAWGMRRELIGQSFTLG
ncbi:DUF4113 domain-containing protein [Stutzerimonas stutzeri]|uniref:DUF4113 domain-containing protein n=1 Tax=Stutzerimonas stutzeri TaxID=316 RepID=UPI003C704E91